MRSAGVRRAQLRALQGAAAAFGAPLGWLTIEWLAGRGALTSLFAQPGLYAYMLFGTLVVFSLFGYYVGRQEEVANDLSLHDPLTGLYNRRYLLMRLEEEVLGSDRQEQPLCLALFDLDHFKGVNDAYGHPTGDKVLLTVARAAQQVLRKNDILARISGDEFAIVFPRCAEDSAREVAERVRVSVGTSLVDSQDGEAVCISISTGLSHHHPGESLDEFYERVDQKLYAAKARGRNCVVCE